MNALASNFLHALREREVQLDSPDALAQFSQAYDQLTDFAQHAEPAALNTLLHALTAGFADLQSNWEFGSLANICGELVERGGDPAIAIEPILDRLTQQFARIPEFVQVMQEHLGVENPNRVASADWPTIGAEHPDRAWVIGEWYALQFTGCAAMAMLVRDVELRKRARECIDLRQRAESSRSENPYAYYIAELLGMADDERLLVLDMPRRLGFRVRLTAVRNNFHLFTLLQDALLSHPTGRDWQGQGVNPLVVAVAKSERMLPDISPNEWGSAPPHDDALWSYYPWLALKPDGSFQAIDSHGLPAWVWGEMKPTEIPQLEGEQIVLLGTLETPRSWDVGFFAPLHSALRSTVRIDEVLTEEEWQWWIKAVQSAVTAIS